MIGTCGVIFRFISIHFSEKWLNHVKKPGKTAVHSTGSRGSKSESVPATADQWPIIGHVYILKMFELKM